MTYQEQLKALYGDSYTAPETPIEQKQAKLAESVQQKEQKFASSNTQKPDDLSILNQDLINPVKQFINNWVPFVDDLEVTQYNKDTGETELLSNDGKVIATGYTDSQGTFQNPHPDADSPLPHSRLLNVDAPETNVNSDKWKYFTSEFGYSNEDMLKYGKEADEWSKKDLELNPDTKFELTGEYDASGDRDLVRSDIHALAGVEAGMFVPSRDASPEFWEANAKAKKNKVGLYRTQKGSEFMDAMTIYNKYGKKSMSLGDKAYNTLWAAPANMVASTAIEVADSVLSLGGGSLGTSEARDKMASDFVGLDHFSEQKAHDVAKLKIETMVAHGDASLSSLVGVAYDATTSEMLTGSVAYLVMLGAGGTVTAAGKLGATAKVASTVEKGSKVYGQALSKITANLAKDKKLSTFLETATDAQKIAKAEEIASQASASVKMIDYIGKNAGLLGVSLGNTNKTLEQFKENNNGEDASTVRKLGTFVGSVLLNNLDRFIDTKILGDKESASIIKGVVKHFDKNERKLLQHKIDDMVKARVESGKPYNPLQATALQELRTMASTPIIGHIANAGIALAPLAPKVAGSASVEGLTEGLQGYGEKVLEEYGSEKYKDDSLVDIALRNKVDLLGQVAAGAGSGPAMMSVGGTYNAISEGTRLVKGEQTPTTEESVNEGTTEQEDSPADLETLQYRRENFKQRIVEDVQENPLESMKVLQEYKDTLTALQEHEEIDESEFDKILDKENKVFSEVAKALKDNSDNPEVLETVRKDIESTLSEDQIQRLNKYIELDTKVESVKDIPTTDLEKDLHTTVSSAESNLKQGNEFDVLGTLADFVDKSDVHSNRKDSNDVSHLSSKVSALKERAYKNIAIKMFESDEGTLYDQVSALENKEDVSAIVTELAKLEDGVEQQVRNKEITLEDSVKSQVESIKSEKAFTSGVSQRTIDKLATQFKIDPIELSKSINESFGDVQIRQMKSVGKRANNKQYEIYHGKDGIIPTYTAYKTALSNQNVEEAVKQAKKLKKLADTQETKFRQYTVQYNALVSDTKKILDGGYSEKDQETLLNTTSRKVAKGITLTAKDIYKDLDPASTEDSKAKQILAAQEESVHLIERLLDSTGINREQINGTSVSSKDDLIKYKNNIPVLEAEIAKLRSKKSLTEQDNKLITAKLNSIENNKAGIERIEKNLDKGINTVRFVPNNTKEEESELKRTIRKLNKISDRTDEENASLKEAKNRLKGIINDKETVEAVKANLGAKMDQTLNGTKKEPNNHSEEDTEPIIKTDETPTAEKEVELTSLVKEGNVEPKSNTVEPVIDLESELVPKKEYKTDEPVFEPVLTTSDAKKALDELVSTRDEINTLNNEFRKDLENISKEYDDKSQIILEEVRNVFSKDVLIKLSDSVVAQERSITKATTKLEEVQKRKNEVSKELDIMLKNGAEILAEQQSDGIHSVTNIKDAMELLRKEVFSIVGSTLAIEEQQKQLSASNIKGLRANVAKIKVLFNTLVKVLKGSSIVAKKYIDSNRELYTLNIEIDSLQKHIKAAYRHKVRAEAKLDEVVLNEGVFGDKVHIALDEIQELKQKSRDLKNTTREERIKLQEKAKELSNKLKNSVLFDNWLKESAGKDNKGNRREAVKTKDSEFDAQEIDLTAILSFKKTMLGAVPIEQLYSLLDPATGTQFKKKFEEAKKAIKDGFVIKTYEGMAEYYGLMDSPLSVLLFNKDGTEVNDQMVGAIAMTGMSWLGANGSSNLFNTKADVARMLGYLSENQVSDKEYNLLKDKGSFRKVVAHSLGGQLLQALGIRIKEDVATRDMADKIRQDAGAMVLGYLEQTGSIKPMDVESKDSHIPLEEYRKATMGDDYVADESNTKVTIPMIQSIDELGRNEDSTVETEYAKTGKLIKNVLEQMSIEPFVKNYLTKTPYNEKKDYNKVKGSYGKVPEESQEVWKTLEKEEYGVLDGTIEMFNDIFRDEDTYLKNAGYKNLDDMRDGKLLDKDGNPKMYTKDEIDSQEGKNREVTDSYEAFVELQNDLRDGMKNSLFFKWFFTKNGRFILDSEKVNPQTDKTLLRWLVLPKASQNKEWDVEGKDFKYFKQGIAQGFGFDIDKEHTKDINDFAEAVMEMEIEDIKEGIRNGKLEVNGKGYGLDHIGHAIQAIVAVEAYQNRAGDKFTATMVSEYDSVTSGFAHKLLQTPVLKDTADWISKTGIFIGDWLNKIKGKGGMNDIIAYKIIIDSYRTLAAAVAGDTKEMQEELAKVKSFKKDKDTGESKLTENVEQTKILNHIKMGWEGAIQNIVEDDKVTSWGRNLFKYPFMIFNYAASIQSIRRSVALGLSENVISGILNNKYKLSEEHGKAFLASIGITTQEKLEELQKQMVEKNTASVTVQVINEYTNKLEYKPLVEVLIPLFDNTYGRRIEEVMTEKFGPLVEINNTMMAASKVMFQGFKLRLEQEIAELQDSRKDSDVRGITQEEYDNIIESLNKEFPMIKAPNSANRQEGVGIIGDKLADTKDSTLPKGSITLKRRTKYKDRFNHIVSIQGMVREFEEAQAAGAVLPIHWIDGTVIGRVLKEGGTLGIHDAFVVGDDFENKINMMNKATYDVGVDYNLMDSMLEALTESVAAVAQAGIEIDSIPDVKVKGEEYSIADVLDMTLKQSELINKARTKFYGEDGSNQVTVMNIADMEGTAFVGGVRKASLTDNEYESMVKDKRIKGIIPKDKLIEIVKTVIEGCK